MTNIFKRTVTGMIIVSVIVWCLLSGVYTFFILCCAITLIGLFEFYRLFGVTASFVMTAGGLFLCASLLITVFLVTIQVGGWKVLLFNPLLISLMFITVLFRFKRSDNAFSLLAFAFLGQVYITLPLLLLLLTSSARPGAYHANVILGYFFLLWANDTGAYIAGSLIGKHHLAPRISPGKTWEGSAGGALAVAIFVYINSIFLTGLSFADWVVLGVIVIVTGTLGDLVKSAMKRSRNVKDSGKILPGHGGILDRFDSLIGSVPFVYGYLVVTS